MIESRSDSQIAGVDLDFMKRVRLLLSFVIVLAPILAASAQAYVFEIDPHQSHVTFTLDAFMHTVHGVFQLKGGSVRFDPSTGAVGGSIVVDATSGDTSNHGRNHKMHKDVLESAKYPEITFAPERIVGQVPHEGKAQVTLTGLMTLHGQAHEVSLPVPVEVHAGQAVADLSFIVPYVQWGLKNPSTFLLRVSDRVDVHVHAVGRIESALGVVPQR